MTVKGLTYSAFNYFKKIIITCSPVDRPILAEICRRKHRASMTSITTSTRERSAERKWSGAGTRSERERSGDDRVSQK